MKHIVKGNEPHELANWKSQANDNWLPKYSQMPGDVKRDTKKTLLTEQGYICCYCMREIEPRSSHIEHINPQCNTDEQERLNYKNLLSSCYGDYGSEKKGRHCGPFRGTIGKNWYDPAQFVSPLNPDCESYFNFIGDGTIMAVENSYGATMTIESLGLNCSLLTKNRREAIWAVIDECSEDDLRMIYQHYIDRDTDGKFREYCVAVRQVVGQLI
jgi:uncharacterized protein (TIGR02646 family)